MGCRRICDLLFLRAPNSAMRGIDIEFVLAPFFVSPPHSPESSPTSGQKRLRDDSNESQACCKLSRCLNNFSEVSEPHSLKFEFCERVAGASDSDSDGGDDGGSGDSEGKAAVVASGNFDDAKNLGVSRGGRIYRTNAPAALLRLTKGSRIEALLEEKQHQVHQQQHRSPAKSYRRRHCDP